MAFGKRREGPRKPLVKLKDETGQPVKLGKPFGIAFQEVRKTIAVLGEPVAKAQRQVIAQVEKGGEAARGEIRKVDLIAKAKEAAETLSPEGSLAATEKAVEAAEAAEAAGDSTAMLSDADLDALASGVGGLSDTELYALSGLLDEHLDRMGAADLPSRDVNGGGGWRYRQYADGSVEILVDPRPEGGAQGKVYSEGGVWQAITTEIGPFGQSAAFLAATKGGNGANGGKERARRGIHIGKPNLRVKKGDVRVTGPKVEIKGKTVKLQSPVTLVAPEATTGDLGMNYADPWERGIASLHPATYGASFNPPVKGEAVPYMIGGLDLDDDLDGLDDDDAEGLVGLVQACAAAGMTEDEIEDEVDGSVGWIGLFISTRKKRLRRASRLLAKKGTIPPKLLAKLANDLAKLKEKLPMVRRGRKQARFTALINQIENLLSRAPGGSVLMPRDDGDDDDYDDDESWGVGALAGLDDDELAAVEAALDAEAESLPTRHDARIERRVERVDTRTGRLVKRAVRPAQREFRRGLAEAERGMRSSEWQGAFDDAPFGEPGEAPGAAGIVLGRLW
jgi:hypothetical protein